jgi:hypothetical protein
MMRLKQLQVRNRLEALLAEQAILLARELEKTCREAPDGEVLDQVEGVILDQGRDLLRQALEMSLQRHSTAAQKKGRRGGGVPVAANGKAKAPDHVAS